MQPTETPEPEIVEVLDIGTPRRRRHLAPGLTLLAVLAVASTVTVLALDGSQNSAHKPGGELASTQPAGSSSSPAGEQDPRAAALAKIEAALDTAPLPPGSVSAAGPIPPVNDQFATSLSPNEVRKTAWYTAPGTVSAAFDYLKDQPPAGMSMQSYGDGPDEQDIEFATPDSAPNYPVELDYYLARYGSGVALRVDARTTWAPNRPDWSFVPADATSVDITVIRDAYNDEPVGGPPGAPTVQRTLTGGALAQLADALNALVARAPEGVHSCPAILIRASEVAVFHTTAGDIRMAHELGGCAFNATITAPPGKDEIYVDGNDFTAAVLSAVGLPANYGFGSR